MLFFWILGGVASFGGWLRAAASREGATTATGIAMIDDAIMMPPRADIAAEVEAGVRAALKTLPPPTKWHEPMHEPRDAANEDDWRRWTCAAAVGACVLSAASLVVSARR